MSATPSNPPPQARHRPATSSCLALLLPQRPCVEMEVLLHAEVTDIPPRVCPLGEAAGNGEDIAAFQGLSQPPLQACNFHDRATAVQASMGGPTFPPALLRPHCRQVTSLDDAFTCSATLGLLISLSYANTSPPLQTSGSHLPQTSPV